MSRWFLMLVFGVCSPSISFADDWPQWLGLKRNASTQETVAPWKSPPKVLWKADIGEGHGGPVVADGRVFLHTRTPGEEAETITAYDAATGKVLWSQSYPRPTFGTPFGNGPRATPTVDNDRIYTLGITGILTAWSVKEGKKLWQSDTLAEFQAKNLQFGISTSPLVFGDAVLVNVGGPKASIVAFDRLTGKPLWTALDDPASYSSPILIGEGDARQTVFLTGAHLVGISKKGEVLWKTPFKDLLNEGSTTPVLLGDILLGSSVTAGSIGLKWSHHQGQSKVETLWKNPALTCYFSTPVPIDDHHLYVVTGQLLPPPQVTLRCVEAKTGKEKWNKPKVGRYHASLMRLGDGKLLMLDDTGNLILLAADAEKYTELARSKVCGDTWAHPALANKILYIRDHKELKALTFGE